MDQGSHDISGYDQKGNTYISALKQAVSRRLKEIRRNINADLPHSFRDYDSTVCTSLLGGIEAKLRMYYWFKQHSAEMNSEQGSIWKNIKYGDRVTIHYYYKYQLWLHWQVSTADISELFGLPNVSDEHQLYSIRTLEKKYTDHRKFGLLLSSDSSNELFEQMPSFLPWTPKRLSSVYDEFIIRDIASPDDFVKLSSFDSDRVEFGNFADYNFTDWKYEYFEMCLQAHKASFSNTGRLPQKWMNPLLKSINFFMPYLSDDDSILYKMNPHNTKAFKSMIDDMFDKYMFKSDQFTVQVLTIPYFNKMCLDKGSQESYKDLMEF